MLWLDVLFNLMVSLARGRTRQAVEQNCRACCVDFKNVIVLPTT